MRRMDADPTMDSTDPDHQVIVSPGGFSPFVVFGASKSGTTWLQRMLDGHPQIRCHFQLPLFPLTNESEYFRVHEPEVRVQGTSPYAGVFEDDQSESRYLKRTRFMQQIHLLRSNYPITCGFDEGDPDYHVIRDLHKRMVRGVVESILTQEESKLIVGSKTYCDLRFLLEVFPSAKFIHIVRDGRDVAVSMRFHRMRQGVYYRGDEKSALLRLLNSRRLSLRIVRALRRRFGWFDSSSFKDLSAEGLLSAAALRKSAGEWVNVVSYILDVQEDFPDNSLTVKYEDLLEDTERELGRVLNFLSADASPGTVQTLARRFKFDRMSKTGDQSFFRKGTSGDWRNYFSSENVEQFKSIGGDLLIRLGYEKSLSWGLQ